VLCIANAPAGRADAIIRNAEIIGLRICGSCERIRCHLNIPFRDYLKKEKKKSGVRATKRPFKMFFDNGQVIR